MSDNVRPPFDAELEVGLKPPRAAVLPPATITPDMIEDFRSFATNQADDTALSRGGTIEVAEHALAGSSGATVTLLVCRPTNAPNGSAAIYYMHGGGLIAGDRRSGLIEHGLLDWAAAFGLVTVSVEYRLAPEHPDPAPRDDCYDGLVWTAANARNLGVDPNRILLVGVSAGGGLAAGLALISRDRGGPPLIGQMLLSPMLDDRETTYASTMLHGEGVWDRTSNATAWTALLGDRRGGPDVSSYAAPARAHDLRCLPPAYIDIGSVDTFRDEATDYANRMWQAGGSAELHVWPGAFHGFEVAVPDAAVSRACAAARAAWIARLLGSPTTTAKVE